MGYKRCLECRGKGHVPIGALDLKERLAHAFQPKPMMRDGVPVRTCEKCDGRGFMNQNIFRK